MRIDWYFDFISPFAHLAWPAMRRLGETHELVPRPLLFAGLLGHLGQKGPAEIPGKREFTYRFVQFQAERLGVPLCFPPTHPFNPLMALRLCIAAGSSAAAVTALFDWIWTEGKAADSVQALAPVAERLAIANPEAAIGDPKAKAELRSNFEAAKAAGVFGVPTAVVDGECFWGLDALPMLEAYLQDPALFTREPYTRLASIPASASRQS